MNKHVHRAMAMWEAAKPASGFKPETALEWQRLLRAQEELGYAMYLEAGLSDKRARELAVQIHGGPVGMVLLRIAFGETSND